MKKITKLPAALFFLLATFNAAFSNPAILEKGDILLLAVNADNGFISGIPGEDELSFVCFKDLTNGTVFEITDNGWERQHPNYWGDSEGILRVQRTGQTIPAGTVITFRFSNGNYSAIAPDNNWSFTSLNNNNIFDINNGGDQIFFLQGGAWSNPAGANNASYINGKMIYAFNTASGWMADGTVNHSNLYPGSDCFSWQGAVSDYLKYTGTLTAATHKEWIERINNNLNWNVYPGSAEFVISGVDYTSGVNLAQLPGTAVSGKWTGVRNSNWFDCSNWDDFIVPSQNTNVFVNSQSINSIHISEGIAQCANMEIDGGIVQLTGNSASLNIAGNLSISGSGTFSMEENEIRISGNILSFPSSIFNTGNGTVVISGNDHVIGGGNETVFHNLVLNGGKTSLYNNVKILNNLYLNNANLSLNTMTLFIENPLSNAITTQNGHIISETFPGSYGVIDWNIGHRTGNYIIPFGTNETPSTDLSFGYNIQNTGSGATMGRVQFISYPTNAENKPFPLEVTQLTNPAGKETYHRAVDRYWIVKNDIENLNFSIYPQIEYVFKYSDADYSDVMNAINKDNLIVRGYNPVTHTWNDWLNSPAFSQPVTNTISVILSTGSDYHGVWTLMDDSNPLPIELIAFSANCNNDKSEINWTTASETNNNFFTIERSMDGKNFEILKTIPGSTNSNYIISYATTDEKPYNGITYYRLKQTDYDGSSKYSNIVSVNCGNQEDGLNISMVSGNEQGISLIVHASFSGNYFVNVMDAAGKNIANRNVVFGKGNNTITVDTQLSAGIYFINIGNDFDTVNRKFFVK